MAQFHHFSGKDNQFGLRPVDLTLLNYMTPMTMEACVMAEARVGVKVSDDRKTVTIEIGSTAGPSHPVGLDLNQLTKLIQLLGQARSRMVEGLQKLPLDGKTVETVIEPPWYVQVASIDGSLLAFDHPSYGPLAFAIPREDVVRIVRILNEHLALPTGRSDKPS
jgi:hypothetical protein